MIFTIMKLCKRLILAAGTSYLAMLSFSSFASEIECDFRKVSTQVHVIVGSNHETCSIKEVEHPLTNPAIIIGESGVIVIDPGSSLQVGRLVLERMELLTDKPVVAVFNTHIHGLYWLGNQAVKELFPSAQIYAHRRMIERIKSGEGDFWVKAITGNYQGENTKFVLPEVALSGGEIETIAGVKIKIHHTGHAHTDHDILIEIPEDNTVLLGGLVVEPEVPSQGVPQDANFKGQMAATQYAIDLNAVNYIPGRGIPSGIELPKRAFQFLDSLYNSVQRYYEDGFADFEITERLKDELSEFTQWYDFSQLGGVVSQMYLQIEQESF